MQNSSGYEKFVVGLSLRISIIELTQLSSPNFICIDEGFGCMDGDNIQKLDGLFEKLKKMYDITIIVSHLDELKGKCDDYVNITKQNSDSPSYVKY